MSQPDGQVIQIASVVNDLDQALEHWTQTLGVGPFFVLDNLEVIDPVYRGKPSRFDATIALGYSGSVCIELIKQNDDAPSVFKEFLESNPNGGFHHWAVGVEDLESEVARYQARGHDVAFSGRVAVGDAFAYMDTSRELGGMIELIKLTPVVRELFTGLEMAAVGWDGSDPVRRPE